MPNKLIESAAANISETVENDIPGCFVLGATVYVLVAGWALWATDSAQTVLMWAM